MELGSATGSATIDDEIRRVQSQIKHAESQAADASTPADVAYWRQKEILLLQERAQLHQKEALLLQKEIEEKAQLHQKEIKQQEKALLHQKEALLDRQEKALSLQKSPPGIAPDAVLQLLEDSWTSVKEACKTLAMSLPEDLKKSFAVCKVPVCLNEPQRDGARPSPSLLWHRLDETSHFTEDILRDARLSPVSPLVILLDVSGAGKTRTLYEIACKERCIYLTGVPETGFGLEGASDLLAVAKALERLHPGAGPILESHLRCCLKALLLCRFFMIQKCEELLSPMQNITWLFKQVKHHLLDFPVSDYWKHLTELLLNEIKSLDYINSWDDVFSTLHGPIMVDECQEVHRYLTKRFCSGTGPMRSMLEMLPLALLDIGFIKSTVYFAGTGRTLIDIASSMSDTLKNRVAVRVYEGFGGFDDKDALRKYADRVLIDTDKIDFKKLLLLYYGRYRFFTTALERYIANDDPHQDATEFFMTFANDISTKTGDELGGISRTIMDNVIRFFQEGVVSRDVTTAWQLVERMVVMHFFGFPKMAIVNPTLSLLEYGLARVVKEPAEDSVQWVEAGKSVFGTAADSGKLLMVQIEEPIVCMSLWRYFAKQQRFLEMKKNFVLDVGEMSHAQTGLVYEIAVAEMIGNFFDGKAPSSMLPSWYKEQHHGSIPSVYHGTAKLVVPKTEGVKVVGHMTEKYSLWNWIEDVESGCDVFPVFLFTGNDHTFGPDAMFFLEVMINQLRVLIPCVLQVKCMQKMAMLELRKAFDSLDLDELFLHKGRDGVKPKKVKREVDGKAAVRLRELAEEGCLKIVVTTDLVNLQKEVQACYRVQDLNADPIQRTRRGKQSAVAKRQKTTTKPLLGVIDDSNVALFVGDWLTNAVKGMKQACNARAPT